MPLTDDELKAVMMGEAEVVISRLVAERKRGDGLTLTEIEQVVLAAGQQLQRALTEKLLAAGEAERREPRPLCRRCGGRMRHKGYRDKRVVTETGEVLLRRAYFYCETCRQGIFPPG